MRSSLFLGALLTVGIVASAQERPPTPRFEVGLNYSLFRATNSQDSRTITSNGGSGEFVYNFNHVSGVVADLGAYHNGSPRGPFNSDTTFTYLFGPRFNWRLSRVTPYAQFLFGGARTSASTRLDAMTASSDQQGFATAAGGGIDVSITRHIAFNPIRVEYLMSQIPSFATGNNTYQNNLRYSAGVVFRFGEK